MKEDIINYPPALSVIKSLLDLNCEIIHIGNYSDVEQKRELKEKGVTFIEMGHYNGKSNFISKYLQQYKFKKEVEKTLQEYNAGGNDFIWLLNAETIVLLGNLCYKYKTVFHYFEFTMPYVNWKYRLVNPSFNPYKANSHAYKIIQCEYNRAHLFKAFLHLDVLPIVLPNKPYESLIQNNIPVDIKDIIEEVKSKIRGRKVILYQGVFQGKDRRLDEFIESINYLSSEYVFVAMGSYSSSYQQLKDKYESDNVIFVPFIRPPYHLEVTKLAYIGILSYVANENTIAGTINPVFCAPNKIFEYSKFGKPMISNDLPGLTNTYKLFKCGESVDYPITSEKVAKGVKQIDDNYDLYSKGAQKFYESTNIRDIIQSILN